VSIERLGNALPENEDAYAGTSGSAAPRGDVDPDPKGVRLATEGQDEAVEFVRFCYRRRAVAWPELYDEMCGVAARGDFRGMTYEHLERLGIGFALYALPALAALVARVIAEERSAPRLAAAI
jgi:hypothetical protein